MLMATHPSHPAPEEVWGWLSELSDPEIPVVSLTDLGIVRDVTWDGDTLVVAITPTYSGCPATALIQSEIEQSLRAHGIDQFKLERRLAPAWTTDWISPAGREKLRDYGIAPPVDGTAADGQRAERLVQLSARRKVAVACPRCGVLITERVSQFGSTACKASYRCRHCLEPFDYFKCI